MSWYLKASASNTGVIAGVGAVFNASYNAGDYIVAAVSWDIASGTATCTDSANGAMTQVRTGTANGWSHTLFHKIATAGGTTTVTGVATAGTNLEIQAGVFRSDDVNAWTWILDSSGGTTGTSATPSTSTATNNHLWELVWGHVIDPGQTPTVNAATAIAGTANSSLAYTTNNVALAGTQTNLTWTGSVSASWHGAYASAYFNPANLATVSFPPIRVGSPYSSGGPAFVQGI